MASDEVFVGTADGDLSGTAVAFVGRGLAIATAPYAPRGQLRVRARLPRRP